MISTLRSKTRVDTAPTEVQMKLAIAQILGQSYAYNAPVIVLDFEVDDDGEIKGRFRDAARPRVFSFEIDETSVAYKPFSPNRMDSDSDIKRWEEFSKGYSYRVDAKAKGKPRANKPQCNETISMPCGKACISLKKKCRSEPQNDKGKEDLKKLNTGAKEYKKAQPKTGKAKENQLSLEKLKPKPETLPPVPALKPQSINIDSIEPNQKKENFDKEQIESMADSIIKAGGNVFPVILSPGKGANGKYNVISGDLEYHAIQRAKERDNKLSGDVNAIIASLDNVEGIFNQIAMRSSPSSKNPNKQKQSESKEKAKESNKKPEKEGRRVKDDDEMLSVIHDLDHELGTDNYLPIYHLRDALKGMYRDEIDQALYRLQKDDKIDLSLVVEAIHYTQEQLQAGIPQEGGMLIFHIISTEKEKEKRAKNRVI